jgi:hypothetical protein
MHKRGAINNGSRLGTNYGRSGASLRTSRDLLVCTGPEKDGRESNPGSYPHFLPPKVELGYEKQSCRCG